ncbi:hypothetical protein GH714_015367 [Hevea brasiliensis]|uniref:Beta-glucosidase n=1 Tax=Hevea brasiliensis TaxID=3981 RepID=A0A6A6N100_HEVBR|nr:hypothetical protein GH714_015255 [Hevea brasiliensis]KAF2319373.1 hypothetical protein GH714_015281 [Hevea brasiliensis]KAF2319375.1 hypothetical protein GH714_015297 [Hevea brasiliensis]KAF2319378.1 hypothetical protein GH714_015352 [Hevea brasiliensis]KAF2319381.1 hypothetical protein GH714_015367 [Hevea brasiliensis]
MYRTLVLFLHRNLMRDIVNRRKLFQELGILTIEGGTGSETGRGPSVWDTFTHETPDRIKDGESGDMAVHFYNRFEYNTQNFF